MKDNNGKKINVITVLFIISLIAIIIMGVFIYKISNEKNLEAKKTIELQAQIDNLTSTKNNSQEVTNTEAEVVDSNTSTEIETNKNSNVKVTLNDVLDNFNYSNSLVSGDWNITSDGKTIKNGDYEISTNLSKKVVSFRVITGQAINFIVLTEDGEVYYSVAEEPFKLFGEGYNGIAGFSYVNQATFVAKSTSSEGTETPENTYTIFNGSGDKITFSNSSI